MSDPRFEHELQRMFAEAPPRPDAALFAARVRERLDRDWTVRRWLVGVSGAGAGGAALWQLGGSQAAARVTAILSTPMDDLWRRSPFLADAAPALRQLPIPPELIWLLGGLMLLAAGFVVTRVVDEF